MPIKRQTYRLDQIDDWQGPVQQSGPTRDAAAQRVRDRFAGMSPTERVLSELTERPPTPRAAFPLRENAQTSRPMPPMAGQMFLDAGLGALEALDQPPTGMPAGVPYTTPLRLLSASGAVPSALAARAYDASSRGSVMADAPVVDPLQPADKQSMFSTAIAQRGGGKGAQALGFIADLLTPDVTDAFTGGLLPLAAMAGGLKRVNTGRVLTNGLYSRLDEAASMIPTKGVPATGVLNWLKKAPEGISLEEVAYRKLPEWLASQGTKTVTPEMLAAHLKANPAPFPQVKTLQEQKDDVVQWLERNNEGIPQSPDEWMQLSARLERDAQQSQRGGYNRAANQLFTFADDAGRHAEGVSTLTGSTAGQPEFSQYQVPGGENYRETLLTLPKRAVDTTGWATKEYRPGAWKVSDANGRDLGNFPEASPEAAIARAAHFEANAPERQQKQGLEFRSSHYPDDPNILVHTRANDRNLPGPTGPDTRSLGEIAEEALERARRAGADLSDPAVHERYMDEARMRLGPRGRYLEEVQSDAHQLALKKGYRSAANDEKPYVVKFGGGADGQEIGRFASEQAAQDFAVSHRRANGNENWKYFVAHEQGADAVPDLPFKENWPDLGLKQQLIETANDPNAEWMGFTGGKTQADRYDLSKQISQIEADRYIVAGENGWRVKADDMEGTSVPLPTHYLTDSQLADTFGKDMAKRIIERDGGVFEGLDLQVGGEGMDVFYDRKLPKRLEKIVKPFGGTVEAGSVLADSKRYTGLPDRSGVIPVPATEPAWLSRLTPEMKAAMRERGFPLMSLAGPVAAQGIPDDPNSETDDYARLALNMGSMAALGAAAKMTLYRGVKKSGADYLRGRQGGKLVSSAMDQVGEKGAFFSRNPEIARAYSEDIDGLPSPDGGIWVTKAYKKDAPPHWMSQMWGESSHLVDVDKQRGKLRYIPAQEAWRSTHGADAIKRRADKELSGAADKTRRELVERIKRNSGSQYMGLHRPQGAGAAPLHDLTGAGTIYPDDVYSENAVQYYGTGDPALDRRSMSIAHSYKNKPDAKVTIFRAVPSNAGDTINTGDWVTINKNYAEQHGESALRGDYKIIQKQVKARDIFTNGDSIHEWGYDPVKPKNGRTTYRLDQIDR